MLSAVISWESSYSALPLLGTTDTPGIPSSQSSRTRDDSPQISTVVLDRDRTVLRRSEPSSRTALTGEQPDPWELLHPQDAMSRHRYHFTCYQMILTIPSTFALQRNKQILQMSNLKYPNIYWFIWYWYLLVVLDIPFASRKVLAVLCKLYILPTNR